VSSDVPARRRRRATTRRFGEARVTRGLVSYPPVVVVTSS
jgi:hypothetical protein